MTRQTASDRHPEKHIKSTRSSCASKSAQQMAPLGQRAYGGRRSRQRNDANESLTPSAHNPTLSPQLGRRSEHEEPFCLCSRLCRLSQHRRKRSSWCPYASPSIRPKPLTSLQQIAQAEKTYTTTVQTTENVINAYNLAKRMATSPSSLYSGYGSGFPTLGAGHPFERHLRQHRPVDQLDEQGSELYAVCDLRAPAWPMSPSLPVTRT